MHLPMHWYLTGGLRYLHQGQVVEGSSLVGFVGPQSDVTIKLHAYILFCFVVFMQTRPFRVEALVSALQ